MWLEIGCWWMGFAFGYATGMSKSTGTTWKVLGVLAGMVGGIGAWINNGEQLGILLTCLAIGFSFGITIGAILRRKGYWDVALLRFSPFMHNKAPSWLVVLVQTLGVGTPTGIIFIAVLIIITKLLSGLW